MGNSLKSATFLIESRLADAASGDPDALYELGVAYSTGTHGLDVDLIEAHKWFNLAALNGSDRAQMCRAEISEEMTAREIAEAQRQARAWRWASAISRAVISSEISARHSWPRSLPFRAARLNHLCASMRSTSMPCVPVE